MKQKLRDRTHKSVLLANFDVTKEIEKDTTWLAEKYLLNGLEVFQERFIVSLSEDEAFLQSQDLALGSFSEQSNFYITKAQFEFLKQIWS